MDYEDHHETDAGRDPGSLQTRRSFLRSSVLGAAAAWTMPAFLDRTFFALDAQAADSATQIVTGKDGPILVVLQQAGGNDGMNMVIPWADDAYHRARPSIGIPADKVLRLNDYCGLHPNLAALKGLYDDGHLAVIQGVGYPNPNRSHFRSTEIWETASDSNQTKSVGWLGSYFDNCCQGAPATVGLSVGGTTPQAFASPNPTGVSLASPEQYRWYDRDPGRDAVNSAEFFYRQLNRPEQEPVEADEEQATGGSITAIGGAAPAAHNMSSLDFLERTALDAQMSSDQILAISRKTKPTVAYPHSAIADSLALVGRMIAGGLPTRVYYVSHGGYDTHQGQLNTHQRLMAELGEAIGAFTADLKAQGNFERVVMISFSEFGRRVSQNASGGTDHGAAAPMFVIGGGVKPGMYGKYPSLTQLNEGDLMFNVDFRSVYATALDRWLRVPSQTVLGRKFPLLPLV